MWWIEVLKLNLTFFLFISFSVSLKKFCLFQGHLYDVRSKSRCFSPPYGYQINQKTFTEKCLLSPSKYSVIFVINQMMGGSSGDFYFVGQLSIIQPHWDFFYLWTKILAGNMNSRGIDFFFPSSQFVRAKNSESWSLEKTLMLGKI